MKYSPSCSWRLSREPSGVSVSARFRNGFMQLRRRHPGRGALLEKRGYAFARFRRFARLHVMAERHLDVFFDRARPKLLEHALRVCDCARRILKDGGTKFLHFVV